jgi:tetratricopeptide (TPR) repeat protein
LLASAYEENGENKLAIAEYSRIPVSFELYPNAQIHAAMIFKKDGKIPEAIVVIKEAVKKKGDQPLLFLYLYSLYEENKEMTAAENILLEGIKILPKSADLHYAIGVIYEKTNRFPESVKAMEDVLSIDPDNAEALNFIGYCYADRGINLDEAEKMIVKALKIKPDNGYMIDSLGWVHFRQNKLDSAVANLKKAMDLLPDDANVIEHLGDVYAKMGKAKEAQEMYNRAFKIDPKSSSLQKKIEDATKKKNK